MSDDTIQPLPYSLFIRQTALCEMPCAFIFSACAQGLSLSLIWPSHEFTQINPTFLSSGLIWLISMVMLSVFHTHEWLVKYSKTIMDLWRRVIVFIILKVTEWLTWHSGGGRRAECATSGCYRTRKRSRRAENQSENEGKRWSDCE